MSKLIDPQPAPVASNRPALWELVMADVTPSRVGLRTLRAFVLADMQERDAFGRAKYGTPLQPWNGRDALVDAYQEALDLVVYLKQAVVERADVGNAYSRALDLAIDLRAAIWRRGTEDAQ